MSFTPEQQYSIRQTLGKYPEFSTRMRNLSKESEIVTLEGVCNLPISETEIKHGLYNRALGIITVMSYDYNDTNLLSYILTTYGINQTTPVYKSAYLSTYDELRTEMTNIKIFPLPQTAKVINSDEQIEKILNDDLNFDDALIIVNVRTAHHIYKTRFSCINGIDNYANLATRKYFIENLELFQDAQLVYLLDLYLYSNALSLGIEIPINFASGSIIDSNEIGDSKQAELMIQKYIVDTTPIRDKIYTEILEKIKLL